MRRPPVRNGRKEEATAEQPAADDVFTGLRLCGLAAKVTMKPAKWMGSSPCVKVGADKRSSSAFIRMVFPAYAWERRKGHKGNLLRPKTAWGLFIRDDENLEAC